MRLLFLIHRLPCPPDRGAKLRAAAQLGYLARRHEVWCAGFLDRPGLAAPPAEVRRSLARWRGVCRDICAVPLRRPIANARALHHLLSGKTCTQGYFASGSLERRVKQWSREIGFDSVLAFSSSMAPLALQVPAHRRVLELDDLDSEKWRQRGRQSAWPRAWVYRTEARRLARCERQWIAAFDASVVVSRREADLVSDPTLRRRVHVIEADLMQEALSFQLSALSDRPESIVPHSALSVLPSPLPEEPVVGFIGAMDYPPNVEAVRWFAESIWPRVRMRRPDASWWVVGRSPLRSVRKLDDGQGVRVTGTVPAVEPYLERMRVHVAPLRQARGVQIKVLVAMAAGRPCVVTPCVAEGIEAQAGRDFLVADSPVAFADAVLALLADRARAEAIGRSGRDFVVRRSREGNGSARLEELLSS